MARQYTPARNGWPRNTVELRSVIQRAVALAEAGPINIAHLPQHLLKQTVTAWPFLLPPEDVNLEAVEQQLIRQALEQARGNKSRVAELLELTRHTLL